MECALGVKQARHLYEQDTQAAEQSLSVCLEPAAAAFEHRAGRNGFTDRDVFLVRTCRATTRRLGSSFQTSEIEVRVADELRRNLDPLRQQASAQHVVSRRIDGIDADKARPFQIED